MKKTLLFSNVIGDICNKDSNIRFNNYMEEYLKRNINNSYSMVFIGAPGLGGEENYLSNIIECFNKINIVFESIIDIEKNTSKEDVYRFLKENEKIVFFLMGGNPLTQMEIIKKLELEDLIKKHDDLVIGFCAGAINLSRYSIITTDEDFKTADSYNGIFREDICIEPHYNSNLDNNRNKEIEEFAKKYHTKIYAIPDESILYIENSNIFEFGKIYYFE